MSAISFPIATSPSQEVSFNPALTAVVKPFIGLADRVVSIGTSLTDNGFRDHTEGATILGYGSRGVMNWVRLQTDQSFEFYNVGKGGDTIDDMLNRFDHDVTPLEPDWVFIDAGTNDSTKTLAEYKTKLTELYTQAQSVAKKGIIIYQIPYRGSPVSDAVNTLYSQVNEWIAATYPNVVDTNKYFSDLSTKRPLTDYTVDGIHYSNVGAYQISRSVLEAVGFASSDIIGTALTTNPALSGSGGTQDAGVTGTMPDGYHFDILSGTATVAVDTDLGHLKAAITPVGEATFRIRCDNFNSGTDKTLYEMITRLKLSDWDGWDYIHLRFRRNDADLPSTYDLRQEADGYVWPYEAMADFHVLRTESLIKTAAATGFTPYIEFGTNSGAMGTGELEIDLCQVQEFTPPTFADVAMTVPDIEVGFRANAAVIEYATGTQISTLHGKHGEEFNVVSTSYYPTYDATAFDGDGGVAVDLEPDRLMVNANIPDDCLVYGVFELGGAEGVNFDTFGFGTTSTNDFDEALNKFLQSVGQNRWYSSEGGSGSQIIGPSSNDYRNTRIAIIAEFKNGLLNYYLNDGATALEENIDIFDEYIDRARFIMGGGKHETAELWLSHHTFDTMHITPTQLMNDLKTRWGIS